MSTWKDFCRAVESKVVRRHFGDLVSVVNTSAVFEFTDEQLAAAAEHRAGPSDDPIPPFPFPRICCVGSGGVVLLQEPSMGASNLVYDSIVWLPGGAFFTCRCTASVRAGELVFVVSDRRCISGGPKPTYFDDTNTLRAQEIARYRREREAREIEFDTMIKHARELAASRDRRTAERGAAAVASLQARRERTLELHAQLEAKEREVAETAAAYDDAGAQVMREAFMQGLRNVIWINKPDHYTVQVGVGNRQRKGNRGDRVRRRDERPHYIVLTKREIADAWHKVNAGDTHASPLPHLRRGHYRRLQASPARPDGRVVWVRAAHVNGECVEWRDGDVRYKVV